MKNKTEHIYVIEINCYLDENLKDFQEQLAENEQIVSQVVAGTRLVITTRRPAPASRPKNLLVEERKEKK